MRRLVWDDIARILAVLFAVGIVWVHAPLHKQTLRVVVGKHAQARRFPGAEDCRDLFDMPGVGVISLAQLSNLELALSIHAEAIYCPNLKFTHEEAVF